MTRPLLYSLLMLIWMIISLYISTSSSQPLATNQNDFDSAEEIEQWSFKGKRPFCNAFAGCGRKRSMLKDAKRPYGKAPSNYPRLLNADTKLLEKVFAKLQHQRANSFQLDDTEYY